MQTQLTPWYFLLVLYLKLSVCRGGMFTCDRHHLLLLCSGLYLVQVTADSMTLVVSGRAKYTQAQGVLESSLFQEYDCAEGAKFGINLTTLLECLQIFGPSSLAQTSVSMAYQEVRCAC